MKKKITAILMAAALTVSLAACAGSNTESAVTESSTSSAVSSTVSEKNDASSKPSCKLEHRECKTHGDTECKNGKQQNRELEGKQLVCHV